MFKLIETTETILGTNKKKYRITLAKMSEDKPCLIKSVIHSYTSDKSMEDAKKAFNNVTGSLSKEIIEALG